MFDLLPVFNKLWAKALTVMKSSKQSLCKETVASCIHASDHAFLLQVLKHHRGNWIKEIKDDVKRKKGMTSGSNKLASDFLGYNQHGALGLGWMESAVWWEWIVKGMSVHEPELSDTTALTDADILAVQDSQPIEVGVDIFGKW